MSRHHEVFSDDVCFEILSFVEESWLIIQDYALISKQWLNVIRNRIKLYLAFWQKMNDERANLMLQSQFINNINRIIIYNYEFTIDGEMFYKAMQQMKNLTSLSICSHHFGPEGARLVSGVKQLENLVINLNSLGPEGAKIISEMENLKSLIISNNEIDDEGAIYLSGMKKLENLDVSENKIGRDGLKAISKMKQLKKFVNRGGIDLEELSNMDQLTHLDVSESVPAFFASDSISFNNLTKLVMKCCCIDDEEVEKISKFPNLTSLHVSGNQITSKGIKHLKEMKHLTTLHIGQNYLNDEGVKIITEMKQLTSLNTEESDLSENAREMLLGMKKQLKVSILMDVRKFKEPKKYHSWIRVGFKVLVWILLMIMN